jgi:hypothetical protein
MLSRWVLLVVLVLAGCGGAREVDDQARPLQRQQLVRAFAAADEPLTISLDLSGDPRSPLDVIFVPEREDVPEPPFEVNVFRSAEAADVQAESMALAATRGVDFVVWKNVILVLARTLPDERREHLIETLESL